MFKAISKEQSITYDFTFDWEGPLKIDEAMTKEERELKKKQKEEEKKQAQ